MGAETNYGGKPGGSVRVPADGKWHRLDIDVADPRHSGLEIQEMYVHCDLAWADPSRCGIIRVKYVRENNDATAYQDFCVAPGAEDWLISHNHSEHGIAGQGGRWWVRLGGGLSGVSVTTRYAKDGVAY